MTPYSVPEEPLTELRSLVAYRKTHSSHCLLCDYAQKEVDKYLAADRKGERVVVLDEESGFVALVPFWATWPFEIMGESQRNAPQSPYAIRTRADGRSRWP